MIYEIDYSSVEKFFLQYPEKKDEIKKGFDIIAKNPDTKDLDIKKLKYRQNRYRLKLGKYCFSLELQETKF